MEEKSKDKNVQQNILNILETASGDPLDIAYAIYNQIREADVEESEIFMFFLEKSEDIESSDEKHMERMFSEEEKYQYARDYGKIIDGTLEALLKRNYNKERFYSELWKFIEENPLLDNEKLKAFALYYIWVDSRIPYYELDEGIKMSNDEYSNICLKMTDEIKKARFILNVPTEQKTERASRLVQVLDEIEGERERAVFMSQIVELSERSERILAQLMNNRERLLAEEK